MDKLGLRLRMIEHRGQLTADQVTATSAEVTERLISLLDWSKVKNLHSYRSSDAWNEIRTEPFLALLKKSYPTMNIVVGPVARDSPLPASQFDVVLVPLLGFDDKCNRLGFGGGWYDKFLATQTGATMIGLAYDFQLVPELPTEQHDVRLSKVVTENRVYG